MDTPQAPAISENGVITAGGFGGFRSAAPGSFIEIYGSNLAGEIREVGRPEISSRTMRRLSLEGVSVTVDGRATFVNYVSPDPGERTASSRRPDGRRRAGCRHFERTGERPGYD